MNNERIKEIALHAGFKLKEQPDGSMDLNPYVYTFARHLLAERAASPAESVDTLANGWPAYFHMIVKGAEDAAHAEGRRSALEELHPQWLKEKERAGRAEHNLEQVNLAYQFERQRAETAEAALTANRAGREYVALSDKELSDPEYMRAYVEGCQESFADLLAARQAPDLTKLKRYDLRDAITREEDGLPELLNGDYVRFADVQALLAQPLRQEGGTVERQYCRTCDMDVSKPCDDPECRAPQPSDNLQQASTSKAIQHYREGYPLESFFMADEIAELCEAMHEVTESDRAAHDAAKQRRSTAQEEPAKHCKFCGGMGCEACSYQEAASTAQAASAKMECPICGVDRFKEPCPNMADECPMIADAHLLKPAKEAASATDAGQTDSEARRLITLALGLGDDGLREGKPVTFSWGYLLDSIRALAQPSQTTPEGADLPPLPKPMYGYDSSATIRHDITHELPPCFTADQMREYARAALADQPKPAPEGADLPIPHTFAGFRAAFHMQTGDQPNGQDAFNAGMRAGRDLAEREAATTAAEPVAWTDDAEKWGNALNEAGWEFIEVCPEKSTTLFNHVKPALRAAILKYASVVSRAAPPQQVGTNGLPG
jgi:hypothetical protein